MNETSDDNHLDRMWLEGSPFHPSSSLALRACEYRRSRTSCWYFIIQCLYSHNCLSFGISSFSYTHDKCGRRRLAATTNVHNSQATYILHNNGRRMGNLDWNWEVFPIPRGSTILLTQWWWWWWGQSIIISLYFNFGEIACDDWVNAKRPRSQHKTEQWLFSYPNSQHFPCNNNNFPLSSHFHSPDFSFFI